MHRPLLAAALLCWSGCLPCARACMCISLDAEALLDVWVCLRVHVWTPITSPGCLRAAGITFIYYFCPQHSALCATCMARRTQVCMPLCHALSSPASLGMRRPVCAWPRVCTRLRAKRRSASHAQSKPITYAKQTDHVRKAKALRPLAQLWALRARVDVFCACRAAWATRVAGWTATCVTC